jgi:DNA mismatch repair protein MutS2
VGGIEDVRPAVVRARDGELLEGRDLLAAAYTLDAAAQLRRFVLTRGAPRLSEIAGRIGHFDAWLQQVRVQLTQEGDVRDDATPKLRDVRRRLRPLRDRIRQTLEGVMERHASAIQDPIVTLRRDRYVLSVQASLQSQVPGIVLDQSASGQTVFLEPQAAVAMNNELTLLQLEERDEVRRILLALGEALADHSDLDATFEAVGLLDVLQASARLAEDAGLRAVYVQEDGRIDLPRARHPLIDGCVPNDVQLTADQRLLVVTGPNAGGKTVLLKTLGLAVLMAQSGLFVAAGSDDPAVGVPKLPWFTSVLADIGDEQSIEASLSTYAGHLTNLGAIVAGADAHTLVLIDELGSGTDPDEGAALSQAILEAVLETGAQGLVTTHLAPLKVFASERSGIANAGMRFDVDGLLPTFELMPDQPGRSYALAIAERMGLPQGLLDRASELLGPEGERLERLLSELERQRGDLQARIEEAERAAASATAESEALRVEIERLKAREEELLAEAAAKADATLKAKVQQATRLSKAARQDEGAARSQALEDLKALRQEVREVAAPKASRDTPAAGVKVALGRRVRVPAYDAEGPVVEMRDGAALVQLGLLKVEVPFSDLELLTESADAQGGDVAAGSAPAAFPARFDAELNIRGERVEPALEKLRDFVLEAKSLKVGTVRILHGKGTGTLRDAVRQHLKNDRLIERYEDAVPYEGGHGVTVAYVRV